MNFEFYDPQLDPDLRYTNENTNKRFKNYCQIQKESEFIRLPKIIVNSMKILRLSDSQFVFITMLMSHAYIKPNGMLTEIVYPSLEKTAEYRLPRCRKTFGNYVQQLTEMNYIKAKRGFKTPYQFNLRNLYAVIEALIQIHFSTPDWILDLEETDYASFYKEKHLYTKNLFDTVIIPELELNLPEEKEHGLKGKTPKNRIK